MRLDYGLYMAEKEGYFNKKDLSMREKEIDLLKNVAKEARELGKDPNEVAKMFCLNLNLALTEQEEQEIIDYVNS